MKRLTVPIVFSWVTISLVTVFLVFVPPAGRASPLTLSNSPLFVNVPVDPNVMLLIDNSGSMNNIIWADGYDNATTYPHWGGSDWSASDGNMQLANVNRGSCASGWKEGNNGGTTKCLRLPDPAPSLPNVGATRYAGNYLNYLFQTYADGTDLTTGTIPNDYRMNVARTVATSLVNNTAGMRFGVSRFFTGQTTDSSLDSFFGHGAQIDAVCGSSTTTVTTAISGYAAAANTPLAEAYYELTRYFRGLSSYYQSGVTHTSPLQYRCQKNFIIVITDGLPTRDTTFPTDDPDDVANTSFALPNWDALAPTTSTGAYPNFPQYSDGFQPTNTSAQEGFSLYLDDLAKFGYDVDMKTSGNDAAGKSWQDPKFTKQNIINYTVGFALANQMLQDAASYGGGVYYTATNAAQLTTSLSDALADIGSKTASAVAVAVNSRSLSTDTRLYQALLTSSSWSGDLLAYSIDTSGNVGTTPIWQAKNQLNSQNWDTGRAILTRGSTAGVAFRWTAINASQQADLNDNPATTAVDNDSKGENRLKWLRGDSTNEGTGADFRIRTGGFKLGDIVGSAPTYTSVPQYLPDLETVTHSSFRTTYASRRAMIYVGANDGMLHGFDATTGNEKIAYVPSMVFANLSKLTDKNYAHRYFVDGSPVVGDAYGIFTNVSGVCSTGCWRTVLTGGLGAGGKGLYALDITDPDGTTISGLAFNEANAAKIALWEYTDASSGDMGYILGQPNIVRVRNGTNTTAWAVVFGNGYNSTNENAALYVVNAVTGALIRKIVLNPYTTATGNSNGLSTPALVDTNGDYIVDYAYAGDLRGNLWKVDLTSDSPSSWDSAYKSGSTAKPLFQAVDGTTTTTVEQPITTRPEVGNHPDNLGGYMVYFGTGKYIETGDNTTAATSPVNTFYGVWDKSYTGSGTPVARADLLPQTISSATVGSTTVRSLTNTTIQWRTGASGTCQSDGTGNCLGCRVDLLTAQTGSLGEKQVTNSLLLSGTVPKVLFNTLVPETEACTAGGTGWKMIINPRNCGRTTEQVFDIDGDGEITSTDMIGGTVPVAGVDPGIGILSEPTVLRDSATGTDISLESGSSGDISSERLGGGVKGGRQSWRQLR